MLRAIILIPLALLPAQAADDARTLLQALSDASRSAKTWRAEGASVRVTSANGAETRSESHFQAAGQGPLHLRYEATGADPALIVCDGSDAWVYSSRVNSYTRNSAAEHCRLPVAYWQSLTESLVSASVTGHDRGEFNGAPRECDVVSAHYEINGPLFRAVPVAGRILRTLCIDRTRNLVLWERMEGELPAAGSSEGTHHALVITYSSFEWNPALPADAFSFQPPAGAVQQHVAVPLSPSGTGVFRVGGTVLPPVLIHKMEPEYTKEARDAKLEGTVVLYIEVAPDGTARNTRVLRSLGLGLDQKAIEAVSQWRFRPGTKDGNPVTVAAQIEVNFRMGPPPQ